MDNIAEIIEACLKKDKKAVFALYKYCYGDLMRICYRYSKDESNRMALLNMGFLRIYEKLNLYKDNVPFEYWSKRLMINVAIDEYRKNKKDHLNMQYLDLESIPSLVNGYEINEYEKKLDVELIHSFIDKLPELERLCFNLYAIDGFKHQEVAKKLDLSERTARRYVANARQKLQSWMLPFLKEHSIN